MKFTGAMSFVVVSFIIDLFNFVTPTGIKQSGIKPFS